MTPRPALDGDAVAGLARELGEEGAQMLVRVFLDTTPAEVDALAQAAGAGDATGAARAAHRLRGGCSAVGAAALGDACAELEAAGKACEPRERLTALADGVRETWERTRAAFDAAGGARA